MNILQKLKLWWLKFLDRLEYESLNEGADYTEDEFEQWRIEKEQEGRG